MEFGLKKQFSRENHGAKVNIKPKDSPNLGHVSEAIINLYASHINSLLYPYNHPLISDSLKNAYLCLQKAFRKNPHIHVETVDGKIMFANTELQDDLLILQSYASWLNNRKIKSLFFSDGLTRKELINFHKIISTKILTEEELSKALSEQNIANISFQYLSIKTIDHIGKGSLEERTRRIFCQDYVSTMHYYDDETDQDQASFVPDLSMKRSPEERGQPKPFEGYMSTMHAHHKDIDQEKAPFLTDLSERSFRGENSPHGPVEGYISTMHDMEGNRDEVSSLTDFPLRLIGGEFSERDEQVRSVEMLCEQEITDEEGSIIRSIQPDHMAQILNAVLCEPPGEEVMRRIAAAYFPIIQHEKAEELSGQQRIFFETLNPELKHAFFTFCISLINNNTHYAGQKSEGICYAPLLAVDNIAATGPKRADLTSSAPEALRRTLQNSDFIFDFVVDETAVLHDLEFAAESASLFDNSQLCQLQKAFVADELCSRLGADNIASVSIAIFSEEGSDNMLSDSSFDIMIELIESDALESDLFLKMLGKLTSLADELIEKGEFDKILELYNSLRTQSLQGKNSMYAVSMIRSVFSTDSFNCNAVEALKQYGRKRRESAGKFMLALRSFLVPFLLDALNEENDPSKRRFMITLLTSVRGDVLPFIINRLHDARWYVVRNMLYLLRECNGRSYVKEVKNFLGHKVALVQIEALRTFLSFQDTEADFYVRKFLKSRVLELQKGAVRLAGAYRIKNAVPYMIRLLNEKDMLGQKFLFKKRIIRMLGRIGDGRAVGQLLQICRSTSVVHNNDLQRLKIEIFKTVHFYPLATIGPLLNYGMKSSSKEIVTISNKLIERYKVPYNRGDS